MNQFDRMKDINDKNYLKNLSNFLVLWSITDNVLSKNSAFVHIVDVEKKLKKK